MYIHIWLSCVILTLRLNSCEKEEIWAKWWVQIISYFKDLRCIQRIESFLWSLHIKYAKPGRPAHSMVSKPYWVIMTQWKSEPIIWQKILTRIWKHFSHLLSMQIKKIRKKKISHGGFLSYHLDSKANPAHPAAYFCPR